MCQLDFRHRFSVLGVCRLCRLSSRGARSMSELKKVAMFTNEYPPNVYGGAGVHVEYLTRELTRVEGGNHSVEVLCFGDQQVREGNLTVRGVRPRFDLPVQDPKHQKFQETMLRNLAMAGMLDVGIDVVHCHTWYTH